MPRNTIGFHAESDEINFSSIYSHEAMSVIMDLPAARIVVAMHPKDAVKLMFMLRDSLQDLHYEPAAE